MSKSKASTPPMPPSPPVQTSKPTPIAMPHVATVIKNLKADRKEPIKGVKKAMVKTMTQANLIPHFSYCDEYDMSSLVNLRYQLKKSAKERGLNNISFMPIIIKVNFRNCSKIETL
jgi:2-oxoisovalerate dehydrogenase E2 component (dihydrolipoyl transacylase)